MFPATICKFSCSTSWLEVVDPHSQRQIYLIVVVQCVKIAFFNKPADLVITEADPVIKIPQPDNGIMVLD